MNTIEEVLVPYIKAADALLLRVAAIPDGKPSPIVSGFIRYDEAYTRPLSHDADAWEAEIYEVLKVLFGENSRQPEDFRKLTNPKSHYLKFREELQAEINNCVSFLQAIISVENIKQHMSKQKGSDTQTNKTPRVFISHSSQDKDFVEELVSLLESIGFNNSNLFCSSIADYWIGLSQNILEELRAMFEKYDLFVIFVQSPRYYMSPVSLNEMGAAWVLRSSYCSLLTKDMKNDMMRGVVNSQTIYLKVDSPDAGPRLNELKDLLTETFGFSPMRESTWERKRNSFLKAVCSIKYDEPAANAGLVKEEHTHPRNLTRKAVEEEKNKAVICAEAFCKSTGSRVLHVVNYGQSIARNLCVGMPNPEQICSLSPDLPHIFDKLEPGEHIEFRLYSFMMGKKLTLSFSWTDDSGSANHVIQTIDL